MDTSIKKSIDFLIWVGNFCIYAGDGFWIYYRKFYSVPELYDVYEKYTQ